jgi:hypothetical protein
MPWLTLRAEPTADTLVALSQALWVDKAQSALFTMFEHCGLIGLSAHHTDALLTRRLLRCIKHFGIKLREVCQLSLSAK